MRTIVQIAPTADGGLSACLVSLLELAWEESPAPDGAAGLDEWQDWLAARNLQLVEAVEEPHHTPASGSPASLDPRRATW